MMNTNVSLAAIVPAFNEAGRVSNVVDILCRVEQIDEMIIVDDGSTDGTAQDAKDAARGDPRLKVHRTPENFGKGHAIYQGWNSTNSACLLILDADLINLKPDHLINLFSPVLHGQADMTIGLFEGGYWRADLAHKITPWLTGQRCIRSKLLREISWDASNGYGFETAVTMAARKFDWQCEKVPMVGVTHPLGEIQRGGYHGWKTKMIMFYQVGRAWYISRDRGKAMEWFVRLGRTG